MCHLHYTVYLRMECYYYSRCGKSEPVDQGIICIERIVPLLPFLWIKHIPCKWGEEVGDLLLKAGGTFACCLLACLRVRDLPLGVDV